MNQARFTRIDAVDGALAIGGLLLTLASFAVLAGAAGDLARGWVGPVQPWHAVVGLVIGVAAMVIGGILHTRKFYAAAAAVGLTRDEAKAIADEADDLDDE